MEEYVDLFDTINTKKIFSEVIFIEKRRFHLNALEFIYEFIVNVKQGKLIPMSGKIKLIFLDVLISPISISVDLFSYLNVAFFHNVHKSWNENDYNRLYRIRDYFDNDEKKLSLYDRIEIENFPNVCKILIIDNLRKNQKSNNNVVGKLCEIIKNKVFWIMLEKYYMESEKNCIYDYMTSNIVLLLTRNKISIDAENFLNYLKKFENYSDSDSCNRKYFTEKEKEIFKAIFEGFIKQQKFIHPFIELNEFEYHVDSEKRYEITQEHVREIFMRILNNIFYAPFDFSSDGQTLISQRLVVNQKFLSDDEMNLLEIFNFIVKVIIHEAGHFKFYFYSQKQKNYLKKSPLKFFGESGKYVEYLIFGGAVQTSKFDEGVVSNFLVNSRINSNYLGQMVFDVDDYSRDDFFRCKKKLQYSIKYKKGNLEETDSVDIDYEDSSSDNYSYEYSSEEEILDDNPTNNLSIKWPKKRRLTKGFKY